MEGELRVESCITSCRPALPSAPTPRSFSPDDKSSSRALQDAQSGSATMQQLPEMTCGYSASK